MTTGVLERGTRTPPGRLVFVPIDGRQVAPPPAEVTRLLPPNVRTLIPGLDPALRRADWILVACLAALRAEFNTLSPSRDKSSDGSIGDTSHAAAASDHNPDETGATPYEDSDSINEVHAIDVDATGPWPAGLTFQQIIDQIVANHRAGRDDRLQYIIWNRRIISRSWGWTGWQAYTGANPHDKHGHFSARYTTAQESDTSPWGVAQLAEEENAMGYIENRSQFHDELDSWWTSRMSTVAPDGDERRALRNAPWNVPVGAGGSTTYSILFGEIRDRLRLILETQNRILANVVADDGDLAAIKAEIQQSVTEAAEDIVAGLVAGGADPQDIADLLRAALGDQAAAVGAILAREPGQGNG